MDSVNIPNDHSHETHDKEKFQDYEDPKARAKTLRKDARKNTSKSKMQRPVTVKLFT
jgi:hypothetical protein